jgi:integrase
MGTIKLSLRKDKPLTKTEAKGKCKYPVELVYQIAGQRKYFNTGEKLFEDNWNHVDQKAVFVKKGNMLQSEINQVNDNLNEITGNIRDIEGHFDYKKIVCTPESVIKELKEIRRPESEMDSVNNVFEFIDQYITEHQTVRVKGSLSVYKSLRTHLGNFDRRVTFDKIDYTFFQRFQTFLVDTIIKDKEGKIIKDRLTNITAAKQLSTLKTFLNYAKVRGVNVSDRYRAFKIKQEKLEVIALTNTEFENLLHLDLSANKALEQVRDVFCFACTTGLRYSDLKQLRREHIKADEIKITVKKTKDPLSVPLTPYSKAILKKYKEQLNPLPVISNQKMNDHLKNLCKMAEMNEEVEIVRYKGNIREAVVYPKYKLVGCHTARKTFCTLSLERGMSAEETMSISGHTDYKSFKRYVKVTEERKRVVMLKAWGGKSNNSKLKAVI